MRTSSAHLSRGVGAGGAGGATPPPPLLLYWGHSPPTSYTNARIFTHTINPIARVLDLFPTVHGRICPLTLFIAATPLLRYPQTCKISIVCRHSFNSKYEYFKLSPEASVQYVDGEEQGLLYELVLEVNPGQPVHQLSSLAGGDVYIPVIIWHAAGSHSPL